MKKYFLALLVLAAGCNQKVNDNGKKFTSDIQQLQSYFHIPATAAIVTKGGETIYEHYDGPDSSTVFPMASLTKMFTGQLIRNMPGLLEKEVEGFKVKHILSHTSQGDPGKHFYYSSARFGLLTKLIETEKKQPFEDIMNEMIFKPYSLTHTFLLGDSTDLAGKNVAKPYLFDGETKPGFIDYGFSSSAGIASTVRDIAKFGEVIEEIPEGQYNYGYFSQLVEGKRILWAYGQYDCYSSLFIKVPDDDLIFVMAANNNLMSDPARLIYGDVTTSLFALSFFKNFLDINIDDRKARALAASFLAMYDASNAEESKRLLREIVGKEKGDLSLLHNLGMLKTVAAYYESAQYNEFDNDIKRMSNTLLREDPDNPYANYYRAEYYQLNTLPDSAALYYTNVKDLKNFTRNWYTTEAENWLKQHASTSQEDTASPPRE